MGSLSKIKKISQSGENWPLEGPWRLWVWRIFFLVGWFGGTHLEVGEDFLGSVDDRLGETGEPGDLDAVAFVGLAGEDFAKEDGVIIPFPHCDIEVGVVQTWDASAAGDRTDAARDAEMGLMALGFKQADARKSVDKALKENAGADSGELIRMGLRGM